MASTKEMQARAKARKSANKNYFVAGPVVKGYDSMDDLFNDIQDNLKRSAENLIKQSSPANVDFTLFCQPTISTKELTIGGTKFRTNLFLDQQALAPVSRLHGKDIVAMFQILHKGGSMLLPMTQMTIDDAGHNYRDEMVIGKDDILNRAVAALRLNSNSPVIHHIAMHIAYEETAPDSGKNYYKGIDTLPIYRVWD